MQLNSRLYIRIYKIEINRDGEGRQTWREVVKWAQVLYMGERIILLLYINNYI